jgi:periplasmic protein CpxP/Spy
MLTLPNRGLDQEQSRLIALVLTQPRCGIARLLISESLLGLRRESSRKVLSMRNRPFTLAYGVMLMFGMSGPVVAQDNGAQQSTARQELLHIHTPQSIDQELARLVKDLELTPEQQQQVRPLVQEHHDRIQALLDKNPTASRKELAPQIHGISDETHRQIHALLTDHQKELEKAMQQREHNGQENR